MAKLYTKCDEIPLCKFIEVYNGNLEALVISGFATGKELQNAASDIIQEYATIIGSKSLLFEMSRKNNHINSNIKILLLNAGRELLQIGLYKEASKILRPVGIVLSDNVTENEISNALSKIESNKAYIEMRLLMSKRKEEMPISDKRIDFTKERMLVSAHFKMYIDPMQYTASEYGYMVKMMLDESKEIKNGKRN